jgi:pimeloyl-ACP methyl ester carboxylesterase
MAWDRERRRHEWQRSYGHASLAEDVIHEIERRVWVSETAGRSLRLAYRDAEGAGAPVLLLHGYFGEGRDWSQLAGLAAARRRIAPDLPGHAGSTLPKQRFSFHDAAEDVFRLLDHLAVERCAAIGLSGGGLTLLRMATMRPERFTDLVLVSVCGHFPLEARAFMRGFLSDGAGLAALRESRVHEPKNLHKLLATALAWSGGEDDAALGHDELAAVTARTLLVTGDNDPLCPLESVRTLAGSLVRAQLTIVPEGGHLPIFAAHRPAFVERVETFLAAGTGPCG